MLSDAFHPIKSTFAHHVPEEIPPPISTLSQSIYALRKLQICNPNSRSIKRLYGPLEMHHETSLNAKQKRIVEFCLWLGIAHRLLKTTSLKSYVKMALRKATFYEQILAQTSIIFSSNRSTWIFNSWSIAQKPSFDYQTRQRLLRDSRASKITKHKRIKT